VGSTCTREIFYAAKAELFRQRVLGAMVRYYNSIPVQRTGYDRALMLRLDEILRAGFGLVIFPEGTRFLDGGLHPPKPGIGMLAMTHPDVPIIPVCVRGSNRLRRQIFGRRLTVTFGDPFHLKSIGLAGIQGRAGYRAAAEAVMRSIAETSGGEPPTRQASAKGE
jgi:1-acyl-sn-glycerol-3-phosphate acyltransferase